jgi:hypothetical protein
MSFSMALREVSVFDRSREFASLAGMSSSNKSEPCRRFGARRSNGHKRLGRYAAFGEIGLAELISSPLGQPLANAGGGV